MQTANCTCAANLCTRGDYTHIIHPPTHLGKPTEHAVKYDCMTLSGSQFQFCMVHRQSAMTQLTHAEAIILISKLFQ